MTLHPVDVSKEDLISRSNRGDAPSLDWLDLCSLRIDDDYQRPLGRSNWTAIGKIAHEFEWAMFSPIIAAPIGDETYALIDGQHRVHAAAMIGLRQVPAMIVDVPPSLQAAAFAAVNSRRVAMSQFHIFKAELAAGDEVALACVKAVEAAGCRMMTYVVSSSKRKPRDIFSISEIKNHIQSGRDEMVTRALSAITNSDRADSVDMYHNKVLRAWFATFIAEPHFLKLDLVRFINANDLAKVVSRVGYMRENPAFAKFTDFNLATRSFRALLRKAEKDGQIGVAT